MKKSKAIKMLQNDIAETEFAKELFFLKARDAGEEEKALLDAVVYSLCYYLSHLYDKKEAMLKRQIESGRRSEALRRQKRRASVFAYSEKRGCHEKLP